MGYFWGIYGVVLAAIASNSYRVIDLLFFIPKHVLNDSPVGSIRRCCLMLLCSVVLYLIGKLCLSAFTVDNYFEWIIAAIIVTMLVAICVGVVDFIFERKNFVRIINRVLSMFRRKKNVRVE